MFSPVIVVDDEYMGEEENHLKHDEEFLSRSERDIQGIHLCHIPPRSIVTAVYSICC